MPLVCNVKNAMVNTPCSRHIKGLSIIYICTYVLTYMYVCIHPSNHVYVRMYTCST